MKMDMSVFEITAEEDLLLSTLTSCLCSLASVINDNEEFPKSQRDNIRTSVRTVLDYEFGNFKQIPDGSKYNRSEWEWWLLKAGLQAYDRAKAAKLEGVEISNDSDS